MARKQYPLAALLVLSGLNFFNYVDRSVLFAVLPLIQKEFPRNDASYGFLTTAFFVCYMFTAPFVGMLADRYPRKIIMVVGALIWSAATLMTAVTHNFETLLIRHTIVGLGEATFVTVAPSFLADLFSEEKRGRVFGWFYLNIGFGTAVGYILGGQLGASHGWRHPFYVSAIPGFILAAILAILPEPQRGAKDLLEPTRERTSIRGLLHNGAFWTATLGMAMVTFALGGLEAWMPTFLIRERGLPVDKAGLVFGIMTLITTVLGTLIGGWMGDKLLLRTRGSYYLVSAATLLVAVPVFLAAISIRGKYMLPAMFVAEFLLFLNTAPLNAAVVNSVGASIRATAMAVNLFVIHLLGDTGSTTLIGKISDRWNLEVAFLAPVAAIVLAALVLFLGMKFAPSIPVKTESPDGPEGATA